MEWYWTGSVSCLLTKLPPRHHITRFRQGRRPVAPDRIARTSLLQTTTFKKVRPTGQVEAGQQPAGRFKQQKQTRVKVTFFIYLQSTCSLSDYYISTNAKKQLIPLNTQLTSNRMMIMNGSFRDEQP